MNSVRTYTFFFAFNTYNENLRESPETRGLSVTGSYTHVVTYLLSFTFNLMYCQSTRETRCVSQKKISSCCFLSFEPVNDYFRLNQEIAVNSQHFCNFRNSRTQFLTHFVYVWFVEGFEFETLASKFIKSENESAFFSGVTTISSSIMPTTSSSNKFLGFTVTF